jgi:hypothetical protein
LRVAPAAAARLLAGFGALRAALAAGTLFAFRSPDRARGSPGCARGGPSGSACRARRGPSCARGSPGSARSGAGRTRPAALTSGALFTLRSALSATPARTFGTRFGAGVARGPGFPWSLAGWPLRHDQRQRGRRIAGDGGRRKRQEREGRAGEEELRRGFHRSVTSGGRDFDKRDSGQWFRPAA